MKLFAKSLLCLGLSAVTLSMVSVSANADTNYQFAPKPITSFVTTDYHLDHSLVFRANGQNAIYSRPGTTKGSKIVADTNEMSNKAKSNNINDYFMVYQSAVTAQGVHYYKVVSFDRKVRGYIYVGGIDLITAYHNAETPLNPNGYLNSNRIFNLAYGSQFGAKIKNFNGMNYSSDLFNINGSIQVLNGEKYYHVVDIKTPVINGWINAKYFSNQR